MQRHAMRSNPTGHNTIHQLHIYVSDFVTQICSTQYTRDQGMSIIADPSSLSNLFEILESESCLDPFERMTFTLGDIRHHLGGPDLLWRESD